MPSFSLRISAKATQQQFKTAPDDHQYPERHECDADTRKAEARQDAEHDECDAAPANDQGARSVLIGSCEWTRSCRISHALPMSCQQSEPRGNRSRNAARNTRYDHCFGHRNRELRPSATRLPLAAAEEATPSGAAPVASLRGTAPLASQRHNAEVVGDTTEWIARGAQNLADLWTHLASASGGRTVQWPGVCAADAGSACPFVNSAVLLKVPTWAAMTRLTHQLDEFYAAADGGSWLLWSSHPTPELTPLGYANWGQPPLMLRPADDASPPQLPELRIVDVTDAAGLAAWELTFIESYPLHWLQPARPGTLFSPRVIDGPLRLWLGLVNDEPVGVSAAFASAGVVGVHMVATMSTARGRGYGAALTWQAVLSRPELPAMLQATEMGRPVYERMGFQMVAPMSLWERTRARH